MFPVKTEQENGFAGFPWQVWCEDDEQQINQRPKDQFEVDSCPNSFDQWTDEKLRKKSFDFYKLVGYIFHGKVPVKFCEKKYLYIYLDSLSFHILQDLHLLIL